MDFQQKKRIKLKRAKSHKKNLLSQTSGLTFSSHYIPP